MTLSLHSKKMSGLFLSNLEPDIFWHLQTKIIKLLMDVFGNKTYTLPEKNQTGTYVHYDSTVREFVRSA